MGPRFSQSEHNATFMPTGVRTPLSRATAAAYSPRPRMFTPTSGNVKSTTLSTATARSRSSPPACARPPGPTSCQASRGYDKLRRQPHHFIRSHTVRESTPIHRTSTFTAPMSTPMRSSFQSSTNSSFQNYACRLPAVRMARTKQTARKVRDDRQRGRSHQPGRDWRRDRSNTPPRRARPRSPSPERLECVFCGQISFQRRNHRRHLITKHNCRPDGTPATAALIEEARRGDSAQLTGHDTRYKSREFVETDSDDDTTPMESGASTPSERRSPSPPRGSRQKRTRSESSASPLPPRDTRHHATCRIPTASDVITNRVKSSIASSSSAAETKTSTQSPI